MKNKMDIQTKLYQKGDERALNEILKKIYQKEFSDEYLQWKYFDNPFGVHFCHCAIKDGRIVGFAGSIPYRIKWGERKIIAAQLTDLAVEPELQDKKVFSIIQRANLEDIWKNTDVHYGFTNKHSYRVYKNQGDYAFHVPRMIKVLNVKSVLKNNKLPAIAVKLAQTTGNIGLRITERLLTKRIRSDLAIRTITSFDPSFDTFLETISSSFKIMHQRNHQYLNWRYCQNPLYRYTIYAVEEAGRILGFVVLRNEPGDINRGVILEFLVSLEREDIQHLLLNKITEHFHRCGVDVITCWMFSHSPYYKAFRRHLFMNRKGDLIVLYRFHKKSDVLKDNWNDPRNWHISCGDDESF